MKLYHGSLVNINDGVLKASVAFKNMEFYKKPKVFLTSVDIIAVLHGLNPIKMFAIKNDYEDKCGAFSCYFTQTDPVDEPIVICECYDGMFKDFENVKVYLYECEIDEINIKSKVQHFEERDVPYYKKYSYNGMDFLRECEKENLVILKRYKDLDEDELYKLTESVSCRAENCQNEMEKEFFRNKFKDNYEVYKNIK